MLPAGIGAVSSPYSADSHRAVSFRWVLRFLEKLWIYGRRWRITRIAPPRSILWLISASKHELSLFAVTRKGSVEPS